MCWRDTANDKKFKFYSDNWTWGGTGGTKTQVDDIYIARTALYTV